MEEKYQLLRFTIYHSQTEMQRFRNLIVNSVMAVSSNETAKYSLRSIHSANLSLAVVLAFLQIDGHYGQGLEDIAQRSMGQGLL